MTDVALVVAGLFAGVLLGTVFFGGLWLTTRHINRSRRVASLVLGSFVGRSAIALAGFFLVIRFAGLIGIVSTLLGFMAMQLLFVRLSTRKRPSTRCPR
jgi:F1F0 ATPase subunit 2